MCVNVLCSVCVGVWVLDLGVCLCRVCGVYVVCRCVCVCVCVCVLGCTLYSSLGISCYRGRGECIQRLSTSFMIHCNCYNAYKRSKLQKIQIYIYTWRRVRR